jgi:hypothetical protein
MTGQCLQFFEETCHNYKTCANTLIRIIEETEKKVQN